MATCPLGRKYVPKVLLPRIPYRGLTRTLLAMYIPPPCNDSAQTKFYTYKYRGREIRCGRERVKESSGV